MSLIGMVGNNSAELNLQLIYLASDHLPALLIDCANIADPHKVYPYVTPEKMQQIFVFELELLHKFRDVLRHTPKYARKLQAKIIVVTTSDHLLNYHDEKENRDVYLHAWQLMRKIAATHDVIVGIAKHSNQYQLAKKYCNELKEIQWDTQLLLNA